MSHLIRLIHERKNGKSFGKRLPFRLFLIALVLLTGYLVKQIRKQQFEKMPAYPENVIPVVLTGPENSTEHCKKIE